MLFIFRSQTYEPDILFVQKERAHIITERKLLEAPDLVIEILSASTAHFDRGPKLANYGKAGVREIWLVDPYGPAGTQFFQRQGNQLVEVSPIDGILNSTTVPGFALKISWLWPDANNQLPNPYDVLKELGAI
jgi:Uma2 family endonuclease